jgi:hypothetical protein
MLIGHGRVGFFGIWRRPTGRRTAELRKLESFVGGRRGIGPGRFGIAVATAIIPRAIIECVLIA